MNGRVGRVFQGLVVAALVIAGAQILAQVALSASTPTSPIVIGVWAPGAGHFCCRVNDPDPGAIADQHLFAGIIDYSPLISGAGITLETNCPGAGASANVSGCTPAHYMNVIHLLCTFSMTLGAYQWANANDENAFLHRYSGMRTSASRDTFANPTGQHCIPTSGIGSAYFMNPGDASYNNYLYHTVWTNSQVAPAPYAIVEDVMGLGYPAEFTAEFGRGVLLSRRGNGPGAVGYDWETAHGDFVNGACPTGGTCYKMILNSLAGGAGSTPGPCGSSPGKIVDGHCYADGGGIIDDQDAIDNICSTVRGNNLYALQFEEVTHLKKNKIPGPSWLAYATNTMANLVTHTGDGCRNTVAIDIEFSSGDDSTCGKPNGGCGDTSGGIAWRTEALAWRWLVPNVDGIPDKVEPFDFTIGGTSTEVPYFFEDTLVPSGCEECPLQKFIWNGSTVTEGDGCPSTHGDTGGAIGIRVECINPGAILCQQYKHLFINKTDYGPAAACLNTSDDTTENIVASWFLHDPIGTYKYRLALSGGELKSVPYADCCGGTIAIAACSNAAYCTGSTNLAAQTTAFAGDGSDTLAGNSGVILMAKN